MTPMTNEQFAQMRDSTKSKIESSSVALFSKRGVSVKISEIARHAGISQGLIYRYFPSKDAIIEALIEKASLGSSYAISSVFNEETTAKDKIEKISEMMMGMLQVPDNEGTQLFLFMIQVGMSMPTKKSIEDNFLKKDMPIDYLSKIIKQGQTEKSVKKGDCYSMSMMYWAAVQGLCCYSLTGMKILYEPEMLNRFLLK